MKHLRKTIPAFAVAALIAFPAAAGVVTPTFPNLQFADDFEQTQTATREKAPKFFILKDDKEQNPKATPLQTNPADNKDR